MVRIGIIVCVVLLGRCAYRPAQIPLANSHSEVTVVVFDVGQGDAILCTDGKYHVLTDGADIPYGDTLVSLLKTAEVDTLDLVMLTHPHQDHYGGMRAVLHAFPVRKFAHNGMQSSVAEYEALMRLIQDTLVIPEQIVRRGSEFSYGMMLFEILHPVIPFLQGSDSANANSVVCRMRADTFTFLLTGDITTRTESLLVQLEGDALAADGIKVPHHGSAYASCNYFLQKVQPRKAYISCGAHNQYGHPHADALLRYTRIGAEVHRTDREGCLYWGAEEQK